jgi:UPF0042 nucleotide-binding protein
MANLLIVTGLSGSGKSTALNALEDVGWFCMDNLPVVLLPKVLELAESQEPIDRLAVGVDARERQFLDDVEQVVARLREEGVNVKIIYIDANTDELITRYSATRRRHPVGSADLSLRESIEEERRILAQIRENADLIIDTSQLNVHELKHRLQSEFAEGLDSEMRLRFVSFGFKHGITPEADLVFDVRFIQNPYFEERLKALDGTSEVVADYIFEQGAAQQFLSMVVSLLEFLLPRYVESGKAYLTVAIGCTGGQHRSVAMVERIARILGDDGWSSTVAHRESHRWPAAEPRSNG